MRLIDAERLKDDIAVFFKRETDLRDEWVEIVVDDIIDVQPTADVAERKKGKWVLIGSRLESRPFACSECNYAFQVDTVMGKPAWGFCPNCGAEMESK